MRKTNLKHSCLDDSYHISFVTFNKAAERPQMTLNIGLPDCSINILLHVFSSSLKINVFKEDVTYCNKRRSIHTPKIIQFLAGWQHTMHTNNYFWCLKM